MSATTLNPVLTAALEAASLGLYVVPAHPLDDKRRCTCVLGSACAKPGKHPMTKHGELDATTNPTTIRGWFDRYPHRGLMINHKMSGTLDVAPDSEFWLAEFQRRGLPPTLRFTSGGGPGNIHHLYRRPEGWPVARVLKPDEYDLMSGGLSVIPPTLHASGQIRTWLDAPRPVSSLPEPPAWVREMLPDSSGSISHSVTRVDSDEPPVRLDEQGLQRWRGELVETKPSGEIDRSASLFRIGLELARANASARTIVATLEERDQALGWSKYSGRRNEREFARIANKVLVGQTVVYARPVAGDSAGPDVQDESRPLDCSPQCPAPALRATIRGMLDAFGNEHLRAAEKSTWIKTAFRVHERDSHGEPSLPGAAPPSKRVVLTSLAEELGQSPQTIGRHLKLGEHEGAPLIRHAEGVLTKEGYRTIVEVEARHSTLPETLQAIATYKPPERPKHGGSRIWPCPNGCQAKVREYTRWVCTGCGEVYDNPHPVEHDPPAETSRGDVQDEGCPTAAGATDDVEDNTVSSSTGYQDEGRPAAATAHNQPDDLGRDGSTVCPEPTAPGAALQDESPSPDWSSGSCSVHHRWLSHTEMQAGVCSSCQPPIPRSPGSRPPSDTPSWVFGGAS